MARCLLVNRKKEFTKAHAHVNSFLLSIFSIYKNILFLFFLLFYASFTGFLNNPNNTAPTTEPTINARAN